jgi:hypothetical protein
MSALLDYFKNRLKEYSTWIGIVMVASALGVKLTPELQQAIICLGMALASSPDSALSKVLVKKPQTSASDTVSEQQIAAVMTAKNLKEVVSADKNKSVNDLLADD